MSFTRTIPHQMPQLLNSIDPMARQIESGMRGGDDGVTSPNHPSRSSSFAEQRSAFSSVVLPPLQLPRHASQGQYGPRLPVVEPQAATSAQHPTPQAYDGPTASAGPSYRHDGQRPIGESSHSDSTAASASSHGLRPAAGFQEGVSAASRPTVQAQRVSGRASPKAVSGTESADLPRTRQQLAESFQVALRIRQQPKAARACGFGERDRRVIDPPPILEVDQLSPAIDSDVATSFHMSSVIHASLWDEAGQADVTFAQPSNRRAGGRLMGALVASCINAKDENGQRGFFFAFPDLSCRAYGKYRLRFALVRVDPTVNQVGAVAPIVAYAMSEVFTVYSASEFPGMRPSSVLTITLREQGHNIPIKKGKRSGMAMQADDQEDSDPEVPSSGHRLLQV